MRGQFPVYDVNNLPRVIALARENAAKAVEATGNNAPVHNPTTEKW